MSERLRQITIIIVGFRVQEENSVLYKKLTLPNDQHLGAAINKAFHDLKCDFISLRAVEKKAK
jgi:hypothetical protein